MLTNASIKEVFDRRALDERLDIHRPLGGVRTILVKEDNTFFESRFTYEVIMHLQDDWEIFKEQDPNVKQIILEALSEMYRPNAFIRYRRHDINEIYRNFSLIDSNSNTDI